MKLRHQRTLFTLALALFTTTLTFDASAQKKKEKEKLPPGNPVLWRDPGPVESLDFVGGVGGREGAPQPPFTFVEEVMSGSNPKLRVTDANGKEWSVKFGSEVNAETFATRLAWAVGYFVEPAYFVPRGVIQNVGKLERAKSVIQPSGDFSNARFEAVKEKGVKKIDDKESWSWVKNPFLNDKELAGLRVIMMLLSNWDNKDVRDVKRGSNTAIYRTRTANGIEDRYLITDWGGSMGKWGGYLGREKWDCKGFRDQTKDFVKGVRNEFVQFGYSGQHTDDFKVNIRRDDVQWLMHYLGRITDAQLAAGLRASGATPEEVDCFTQSLRNRILQLKNVTR